MELRLETVSDVMEQNLSFVYSDPREKEYMKDVPDVKWKKMTASQKNDVFRNLLFYKNESVPSYLEVFGLPFPEKTVVNGEVHARKSKIQCLPSSGFIWYLPHNCPWLHHLSYNLLRFYESHLVIVQNKIFGQLQWQRHQNMYKKSVSLLAAKIAEDSEEEVEDMRFLWLLIAAGNVSALLILTFEILFKRSEHLLLL